ncbi:unnamed protein product [Aspergillus oryzae]|uniref:Unnamed protein product n=1 Tax=Aspergillus oryzae TaxID=5062 RepID=A0AAN5C209_ASPOZ|nr:unnamed protein product [Aspergillus oryzae]
MEKSCLRTSSTLLAITKYRQFVLKVAVTWNGYCESCIWQYAISGLRLVASWLNPIQPPPPMKVNHYDNTLGGFDYHSVQNVQTKISNAQSVRLGAIVTQVENVGSKVQVTWTDLKSKEVHSKQFDHVVMAVTPNVVGAIYEPLRKLMSSIPVNQGEAVVHRDRSSIPDCSQSLGRFAAAARQSVDPTQILHICSNSSATEAIHEHPCSVLVTSFPIAPIDPAKVIHRARLTRVLRTPQSRKIVNRIFGGNPQHAYQEKEKSWSNGTGNVWLAGAWCWDGMVLLEGCVVSAMRVAASLDVEVPWLISQ